MELYKEILCKILAREEICITFPNLKLDAEKIVELECYKTLERIKAILADDALNDEECFMKIEEIVCAFEAMGSTGVGRHDFG